MQNQPIDKKAALETYYRLKFQKNVDPKAAREASEAAKQAILRDHPEANGRNNYWSRAEGFNSLPLPEQAMLREMTYRGIIPGSDPELAQLLPQIEAQLSAPQAATSLQP